MGNQASTNKAAAPRSRVQETPLAPQTRFPRVINARFVLEYATSLRLPLGFWSHQQPHAIEIQDADTNGTMFKINPRATDGEPTKKQLLLDKNGVPIVVLDGYPVTTDCAMYVPQVPLLASMATSAWQENRALCYLQTNMRPLEQRLLLELEDPVTRAKWNVRVDGTWQNHEALFWIDRGFKSERECIARVYFEPEVRQAIKANRKKTKKHPTAANDPPMEQYAYRVDIAPGVDVALIVLACAALDEELAKKERGDNVEIGADDTTKLLAQRHHGVNRRDHHRAITGKAMFVMSDL